MARYIDADALVSILNAKADMVIGPSKAVFFSVAKMVELLPTADVVPTAEVERLERILFSYVLQYGTVKDQQEVIDKAVAEVVRKIFEEIEKFCRPPMPECQPLCIIRESELAELKKKYAGGTKGEQNS